MEPYKYENFSQVLQHSFGFLILFTGFVAPQNMQSKIMTENGFGSLGYYNLACVSIFCLIGGFLSTTLIKRYGVSNCLILGAVGDAQWIMFSILPAMKSQETDLYFKENFLLYKNHMIIILMLISSCICGFTTGVLWTAQGVYNSACANEHNKGFYFSFFWTVYMMSAVLGNLISAIVIGNTDQVQYFITMMLMTLSSIPLFATLKKPNKTITPDQTFDSLEKSLIDSPQVTFTPDSQNEQSRLEDESIAQNVKNVWTCITEKRMLRILPQNGWTGISIAVFVGTLIPIMTSTMDQEMQPEKQIQYALYAMTFFGIGELLGGLIIGQVVDRVNSQVACLVNAFMIITTITVTIAYLTIYKFSWLAFLMTFLWGLQDSAINTHIFEILGFEFENNSDPYAVYSTVQSMMGFIFSIGQAYVMDQRSYIVYMLIIGIIGVFSTGITYTFDFKERKVRLAHKINS